MCTKFHGELIDDRRFKTIIWYKEQNVPLVRFLTDYELSPYVTHQAISRLVHLFKQSRTYTLGP